jgi:DNA adenine methylase
LGPLIGRPGGKSRIAKKIVELMPEHEVYVEPMVGGGSVFFNKPPAKKEVVGDADKDLMELWKAAKEGAKCQVTVRSQEEFRRLLERGPKDHCDIAAKIRCSFGSMGNGPSREADYPCKVNWPTPKHVERLRNTIIEVGDFEETMKKYDSPKTLHYLDPPYYGTNNDGYPEGLREMDPARVKRVADEVKGHVIISYNDHPHVRKLFCSDKGYKCITVPSPVSLCSKGFCGTRRDLIIVKKAGEKG